MQGGPGTLKAVVSAAADGRPVVLLADSGGAAQLIASAVDNPSTEEEWGITSLFPSADYASTASMLKAILQLEVESQKTLFYSYRTSSGFSMSNVLLRAIAADAAGDLRESAEGPASNSRDSTISKQRKVLSLAISWRQPDLVKSILAQLSLHNSAAARSCATSALQQALELHRIGIVELLLALPADMPMLITQDLSMGRYVIAPNLSVR